MTDVAIEEVIQPYHSVKIIWEPQTFLSFHPNGMKFVGKDVDGDILDEWTVFSIGGGALSEGNGDQDELGAKDVYDLNKLGDIQNWCYENGRSYWEYVEKCEGPEIWDFLANIWKTMKEAIERGLEHEGVLPGPLKLPRKAANYYTKANGYRTSLQSRGLVYAYALAVSEENASGGIIVTAPTCGACGVLPAVLYHMHKAHEMGEQRILRALATAGLVGNVVKQNAPQKFPYRAMGDHDLSVALPPLLYQTKHGDDRRRRKHTDLHPRHVPQQMHCARYKVSEPNRIQDRRSYRGDVPIPFLQHILFVVDRHQTIGMLQPTP